MSKEYNEVIRQIELVVDAYHDLQDIQKILKAASHSTWVAGYHELSDKIDVDLEVYTESYKKVCDDLWELGKRKQELIEKDDADKGRKD